ncbi:hypothetical protein Y935_000657 [Salmonella enterica subsp. enterica]|nr:hypothetical protein [Salmonella enterica subsp. enterica serovar Chandans]EDW7804500.1 hypothetical protein [Salmonella enterica]EEE3049628.1 hypothetical protein [Salmonella enterica subsp. enterica serovar Duisburg]
MLGIHVFTPERVTLCTIVLMHKDTGLRYIVIFSVILTRHLQTAFVS